MEIIHSPEFIADLKNKYLLLDANVFIDHTGNSKNYTNFFNKLKESDITLATIDAVKYEFLKGSADLDKYLEKETFVEDIIDVLLPTTSLTPKLIYDLIKEYSRDGGALSVTDLTLGAILKQYKENIFLMSRDTTDFIQRVFDLKFVINASHSRGIFTYGVYQAKGVVSHKKAQELEIPF